MLKERLQEVLDLQPEWSHIKTPKMDRRGIIVRREIPDLFRERLAQITASPSTTGFEWAVEGRDGTGPKTEIPWGSYDDVRRVDLLWMSLAEIATNTGEGSKNAPNRKFGLSTEAAAVIRSFGRKDWSERAERFRSTRDSLTDLLANPRRMAELQVTFAKSGDDVLLNFGPGEHNKLIKACIESFLPRWGHGAEVLYVGDADDRYLYKDEDRLSNLGVFDISTDELPDVIAYSAERNWLYVIEAVHSTGPVSREKHLRYKRLFEECTAGVVYVTAFANRTKFKSFAADIAWETEVWIEADPTHLIHYNGDRFFGPHAD